MTRPKVGGKRPEPCPKCGGSMLFDRKPKVLEYRGHTTTIPMKGWWCASCGESVLWRNALATSERTLRDLQAKVECLESWGSNLPDDATILGVQSDLDRLGETCTVSVKRVPRGQWEHVYERETTFEAALDLVPRLLEDAFEVGIFLRGIFIWSSIAPGVANRFEHFH